MRNTALVFIAVVVFTSCKNHKKQSPTGDVANNKPLNATEALIKKFNPIINGVWVKTDYILDITKNKSPYQSGADFNNQATIVIDTSYLAKDTLSVGASLNNHEGSNFTILFAPGQQPNSLKTRLLDYDTETNYYELGYEIAHNDTNIVLYHYNKKNKLIDEVKYTRVLNSQPKNGGADYGISYITNKLLITGKYTLADSSGSPMNIQFYNDSKVLGLGDFTTYEVITDFTECNTDLIYFDDYEKNRHGFSFKLKSDTLNIYEVKENADSTKQEVGKLKYKLVKYK